MTTKPKLPHYRETGVDQILSLVEPSSKILVLASDPEAYEELLKKELNCEVTSSTISSDLKLKAQKFDYAIINTLSATEYPELIIKDLRTHCEKGLILAVQNVSHSALTNELLEDRNYFRDKNLESNSELCFFSKNSLISLLEKNGFAIESILKQESPINLNSNKVDYDLITPKFADFLDSHKGEDLFEYFIKAKKTELGFPKEINEDSTNTSLKDLKTQAQTLSKENKSLSEQIQTQAEEIAWYKRTLQEQLTSHYSHTQVYKDLCELKDFVEEVEADRNRTVLENNRLRKFSPDALPAILRHPVKLAISICSFGLEKTLKSLSSKEPTETAKDLPVIDVVTLLYNSEKHLGSYFEAIKKINYPAAKLRIHLLDNNSPDKSALIVRERYLNNPEIQYEVILHTSKKNRGFAGGNNYVLKKLLKQNKASYFFLLNHDTEISPDCIKTLAKSANREIRLGMIEAKQTPKEHPKYFNPETNETSWCSGGCVLVSAQALKEVGLFDSRFFLYVEDVDLSWRMWLAGWKCKINPEALCSHFTESLNEDKDFSMQQYFSVRNTFFMRYKYGTKQEIKEFDQLFQEALNAQPDELSKNNLLRAKKDAKRMMKSFILDRFKYSTKTKPEWLKFKGFNFGETRKFEDTKDGRRIVYDEVA